LMIRIDRAAAGTMRAWAAALAVFLLPFGARAQVAEAPCIEELETRLTALAGQQRYAELLNEAFTVAQRAVRTDTALTVSRVTERFAAKDPRLRDLLKQVDDIDREQAGLDQLLTHAFKLPKDKGAEVFSEIRAKLAASRERREEIIGKAKAAFPALFRLVTPEPLSVAEVQSLLQPDEVLVSVMAGVGGGPRLGRLSRERRVEAVKAWPRGGQGRDHDAARRPQRRSRGAVAGEAAPVRSGRGAPALPEAAG
jgi:hypothetical protein